MWRLGKKKEGARASLDCASKKVLLLIDWDNLFLCLCRRFKAKIYLEYRIQKLMEWLQSEIGEILEGYGFVFAPEHLSYFHQQTCVRNGLRLITCPKRKAKDNEKKPEKEEDTVDETLIWFGKMMMHHPDVGIICLVAGDNDYVPLMQEAQRQNIKIALAPPTIDSLSRSKKLLNLADRNPKTGRRMVFMLDSL